MWNPFNYDKKLLEYIDQNDDDNFIKYVKPYRDKKYLMKYLEMSNYPILFILISKNKCHEGMKYLLHNGYNSHYKFNNKTTWDMGMKYDNLKILVLCIECHHQHIKVPYNVNTLCNIKNILKTMSKYHSYNVCNEMIMTAKTNKIDISLSPTQKINLLEHYITTYKATYQIITKKIYSNICEHYSSFLTENTLYNILLNSHFVNSILPNNVNIICDLIDKVTLKFIDYYSFVDIDGNTFFMKLILLICDKFIKLSYESIVCILQKLVQCNFDIKYINKMSLRSIRDIIIDTGNLGIFYKIECIKSLFTIKELFIESIYDSNELPNNNLSQFVCLDNYTVASTDINLRKMDKIDKNLINTYKNKKFIYKYYVGTLLHHIYRANNILYEELFNNFNNINTLDSNGCTLLDMALQKNNGELLIFLLGKGATFNRISTFYHHYARLLMSPLTFACCYRSVHLAKILINTLGINIDLVNPDGTTALIASIKLNLEEVSCELISAGANPYIENSNGEESISYINNDVIKRAIWDIEMVKVT